MLKIEGGVEIQLFNITTFKFNSSPCN